MTAYTNSVSRLAVGTRIHGTHHTREVDLGNLAGWCASALEGADIVLLAVDTQNCGRVRAITTSFGARVEVIHVSPWHGVCGPLNALVARACQLEASHLLLRSLEIDIEPDDLLILRTHATPNTLVVGARVDASHGGVPGTKTLDGQTSPWNTLALWNLATLGLTGFLAISDGLHTPESSGVEEVATISLLQALQPLNTHAVLVRLPGLRWHTRWEDLGRRRWQATKMTTKRERSRQQLKLLGLPGGLVTILEP
jgi:hypothetical protein